MLFQDDQLAADDIAPRAGRLFTRIQKRRVLALVGGALKRAFDIAKPRRGPEIGPQRKGKPGGVAGHERPALSPISQLANSGLDNVAMCTAQAHSIQIFLRTAALNLPSSVGSGAAIGAAPQTGFGQDTSVRRRAMT